MRSVTEPVVIRVIRKARILRIDIAGLQRQPELTLVADNPLLQQVRFGKFNRGRAGEAEPALPQLMTQVPRILSLEPFLGGQHVPGAAGDRTELRRPADAREQRLDLKGSGISAERQRFRQSGRRLDEQPLSSRSNDHGRPP
jgi:hypothetical protein